MQGDSASACFPSGSLRLTPVGSGLCGFVSDTGGLGLDAPGGQHLSSPVSILAQLTSTSSESPIPVDGSSPASSQHPVVSLQACTVSALHMHKIRDGRTTSKCSATDHISFLVANSDQVVCAFDGSSGESTAFVYI